jgi:hypothetical protein
MMSNRMLASAILVVAITTTTPAIAADRSELEQLVQEPTSDLSALTNSEIDEAAQLDAQLYFKRKGSKDLEEATSLGKGHALNHHLLGESAESYGAEFASALESLAKTQADESPTPSAKTNSDSRFFAGAHLGMSIKQCSEYYKQLDNVGAMGHSGALAGQEEVDFRNNANPQRRVYIAFRKSDGKILSVIYWKLGDDETFSAEELQEMIRVNAGNGPLTTKLVEKGEFMVTTPKQYRLQRSRFE